MKKIIFFILLISLILPVKKVYALSLVADKHSLQVNYENKISIPINVSISADNNWKLFIQSANPNISALNENYNIPLNRLEIRSQKGEVLGDFGQSQSIEIANSENTNTNNLLFLLDLNIFESEPSGNYPVDIKFVLTDSTGETVEITKIFDFKKEEISKIEFSNNIINFNLDKNKLLSKGEEFNLPDNLIVRVKSNTDWKLYVKKLPEQNEKYEYFISLVSSDTGVKNMLSSKYVKLENTPLLIASGKPTSEFGEKTMQYKNLNISYMLKDPNGKFIKSGNNTAEFEYRLENQ